MSDVQTQEAVAQEMPQQPIPPQPELAQNIRPFNPNEHLMQIRNRGGAADYLPVQWRLVWFRSLCPNGTIETEVVHLDLDRETQEETYAWNNETRRSEKIVKRAPGYAVFRAVVKDGRGGVATGTKSEKAASFADFVEKAETGAIGRALAALGYGTQFTGDEFDERHRIVDAGVDRPASSGAAGNNGNEQKPAASTRTAAGERTGTNTGRSTRQPTGAGAANTPRAAAPGADPRMPSNAARTPQPPPKEEEVDPQGPMTEKQWNSIKKLCQHLGKAEPTTDSFPNYQAASDAIAQLSQEYRQSRSKAS